MSDGLQRLSCTVQTEGRSTATSNVRGPLRVLSVSRGRIDRSFVLRANQYIRVRLHPSTSASEYLLSATSSPHSLHQTRVSPRIQLAFSTLDESLAIRSHATIDYFGCAVVSPPTFTQAHDRSTFEGRYVCRDQTCVRVRDPFTEQRFYRSKIFRLM